MIFDIGANIGNWSLSNESLDSKIIAVEAVPSTYEILKSNTVNKNIICLNYAVCDSVEEEITFYKADANTISTLNIDWLTSKKSRFNNHKYETIKCKTISIDKLIDEYGVPDLIKIDVEGGEYDCIKSLNTKNPLLCFEWASETNDITLKCLDYLLTLGYNKFFLQFEDYYKFRPNDYYDIIHIKNLLENTSPKIHWGMIWCK